MLCFHGLEQMLQMWEIIISIPSGDDQRVIGGQFVEQAPDKVDPLQVGQALQVAASKQMEIFLDDPVAEGMESIDAYTMGLRADKIQQTASHGFYAGIRKGQAEYVGSLNIGLKEDIAYPGSQQLRFSGSRPGKYHHRAFDLIDCLPLRGVKCGKNFLEPVLILLAGRQRIQRFGKVKCNTKNAET